MKPAVTTGGKDTAEHFIDRLRESTASQLAHQKERASDSLGSAAQAVRKSTEHLRQQQHDTMAQYIGQAADQLEKLSTRLKEKNVEDFVADAQQFARQRPALFIGSAFAIGVIGARFFKSSAERNS